MLIGSLLGWFFGIPVWSKISYSESSLIMGVFAGGVLSLIAVIILQSSLSSLSQLRYDTRQVASLLSKLDIFSLLIVSLLAGFCEEFLFRGVLQVWFSDWFGVIGGVLLASVLFGIIHPISISYISYVTIFGILIGWMFHKTGDLLMVMIVHAAYDFFMLVWVLKIKRNQFID